MSCNLMYAGSIPVAASNRSIAELEKHSTLNAEIVGSSPTGSSDHRRVKAHTLNGATP